MTSQQLNHKLQEAYIVFSFFFFWRRGGIFYCFYFLGGTFSCRRKPREDLQSPRPRTGFLMPSSGLTLKYLQLLGPAGSALKHPAAVSTHPFSSPPRTARQGDWCSQVFQEHQQWSEIHTVCSHWLHQHLATNSALIYLRRLLCLAILNSLQIYSGQDMKFSGLLFGQNPN